MAVDYAHPVLTDVYAGSGGSPDWPSYIRDNFTAMGTMFEGLDPAGKTVGFKRVTAGGLFERWNGTAWVAFPLGYFSSAGGNLSGRLIITATPPDQLRILSGSATVGAYMAMGRTAPESYIGVTGVNNGITTGDVPGDTTVRAETRLWFSSGAAGMMRMDTSTGILARYGFQATGDLTPVVSSGVRIGIAGGSPIVSLVNTTGGTDSKYWDTYASINSLVFRAINDAQSAAQVWLEVARAGMTIADLTFPQGNIGMGAAAPGVGGTGPIFNLYSGSTQPAITLHNSIDGNASSRGFMLRQNARRTEIMNFEDGGILISSNNGGAASMIIDGFSRVGIRRVPAANLPLEVEGTAAAGFAGSAEAFRVVNDAGYISFYNTALTARRGYIQFSGTDFLWSNESNGIWRFNGGGADRFIVHNNGYVYAGDATAGNRVITAKELSSQSGALILPGGIRMQWGTVTTTLGAGAVVTIPSAFSTVQGMQATLNGGSGTGWVLRTFNLGTTTFQFNMDNWNTVGQGQQAYVWWLVIGT